MLHIKGIKKSYDGLEAVNHVNLEIRSGEFFSLLGPSGCGKTTLLRIIAGFEKPTSGEIHYNNKRIDLLPPHQRQFNMVFQRYALFPHLNVFDNVAFGPRMKKSPEADIQDQVLNALSLVKMDGFQNRQVTTLSGGQQQRVAVARALINQPKLLLLDEPLSALDLKLRQQMQVELLALQRRLGHSFIFVTHDQEEALTLSDRIAVMNAGNVEQVGTPQEIYEFPRTPFVASFIGTMNIFDGIVTAQETDNLVVDISFKKPVQVKAAREGFRPLPKVSHGLWVKAMVRPEKMKILKSIPHADQNHIEGVIKEMLYQGQVTYFVVSTRDGNGPQITVSQPNTASSAKKPFALNDKVSLAWAPEDTILMGKNGPLDF